VAEKVYVSIWKIINVGQLEYNCQFVEIRKCKYIYVNDSTENSFHNAEVTFFINNIIRVL
jgi:hypothetical protein